jgi:hypothetical protein
LNLAPAILTTLKADPTIAGSISTWENEPSVFTRRPAPPDAPYPLILVSPDIAYTDQDALTARRDVIMRDISVYGTQPTQYRLVELVAYRVRDVFHRQHTSLRPDGYNVIDIRATGPIAAPVDDENLVGRLVTLTVRVQPES